MEPLYRQLQQNIKSQILSGLYREGDLLPSESELQKLHGVNRSVIRQALNLLTNEGYIIKKQGKGSIVARPPRRTLGLLSVKGFSQNVSEHKLTVKTVMIDKPSVKSWPSVFFYNISDMEQRTGCIYLKRLRCVGEEPVMVESTYISNVNLPRLCSRPFVNGSLFETLNVNHEVEITKVDQDLRAVAADEEAAGLLRVPQGSSLLHIYLKFHTNRQHLFIYSSLLCNTADYSIGNHL